MAKRKARKRKSTSSSGRKRTAKAAAKPRRRKLVKARQATKASKAPNGALKSKRQPARAQATKRATRKTSQARKTTKKAERPPAAMPKSPLAVKGGTRRPKTGAGGGKAPRLDRERRTLEEVGQTPPSSLDMVRRGSAVRTGRAEVAESLREHRGMSSSIAGGDVDVNVEDAYFTGDEAPGGDNPTPDQEIVDDIGKALGVEYQDNEELKAAEKVTERDRHRWELDPASSEDYKERK